MSSTWLPNQARADDYTDEQPKQVDYAQEKVDQLKQYGWQVQSNKSGDKTTFIATKTDPKTGETTQAKYVISGDSYYTEDVEHTFKDGSKTSEQRQRGLRTV